MRAPIETGTFREVPHEHHIHRHLPGRRCPQGFVGFNRKTGRYIVRFSEDSFGMDVADDSITPTSEFVWSSVRDDVMRLGREQLQILLEQNINERLNIGEPLLVYLRRQDLPEITAQRQLR